MGDGNHFIGFCYHEDKAYCKKCGYIFKYGYNTAGQDGFLHKGQGNCPKCGAGKTYGDIIREDNIELHIENLRTFVHCDITNDDQKKKLRHEINELNRIRRLFDEYEEKEH
jgi:ribosomal protein S27AE